MSLESQTDDSACFFMQQVHTKEGAFLTIIGRFDGDAVKVDTISANLGSINFDDIRIEHNKKLYKFPDNFIYQGPVESFGTFSFGCYLSMIPAPNLEYLEWKYEHPNR